MSKMKALLKLAALIAKLNEEGKEGEFKRSSFKKLLRQHKKVDNIVASYLGSRKTKKIAYSFIATIVLEHSMEFIASIESPYSKGDFDKETVVGLCKMIFIHPNASEALQEVVANIIDNKPVSSEEVKNYVDEYRAKLGGLPNSKGKVTKKEKNKEREAYGLMDELVRLLDDLFSLMQKEESKANS